MKSTSACCEKHVCLILGIVVALGSGLAASPKTPPPTHIDNVVETLHGVRIVDPYRWLEDQESPETRAWIEAQNQHTRSILDAVPGRERLRAALERLYRVDEMSAPIFRGNRYFLFKRSAQQNLRTICVRERLDGADRVLLDPANMSPDQSVSVHLMSISRDGKLLAYGVQRGGEDEIVVELLDVDTGQRLADRLPRATYYNLSILPDKSGFYYSRRQSTGTRLYFHAMGTEIASDREIFGEGFDDQKLIWFRFSEDGRYIAAFVNDGGGSGSRTRIYTLDRARQQRFQPLVEDIEANFSGAFGGDHLFVRTTWNAPNGRLLDIDLKDPRRERWREVIPESKAVLEDAAPAGGKLVASFLENVSTRLKVFDTTGKLFSEIALPTLGTAWAAWARWESDEIFYHFTSFAQVGETYRYARTGPPGISRRP
ncbi:MAG: hypothetical protein HY236_11745 [Acidobacteria bacterium]|nr:hypothetical protein [Acidobacteriota bacterium]